MSPGAAIHQRNSMAAHWLLLPSGYGLSSLMQQLPAAPGDSGEQGSMVMGLLFSQEHRLLAHCHVDKGGQASPNDRGHVQGADLEGPPRCCGEHAALGLGCHNPRLRAGKRGKR
jgi:hypothetical protein